MKHPYEELGHDAFWRRSVAAAPLHQMNLAVSGIGSLHQDDRVMTMGSCFAQHLAKRLDRIGLHHLVTEAGPEGGSPRDYERNFGAYSARYGNVYTPRQAVQLVLRCTGELSPLDEPWTRDGRYFDPFRPSVEPGGFRTLEECMADQAEHLSSVREALETATVLVFTLGLTECWIRNEDGAVLPVVPGSLAGQWDPTRFHFENFGVDEVRNDLVGFISLVREINPSIRFILTVSPVPLAATYSGKHVLLATTYSKSILRVCAQDVSKMVSEVDYFPSFEIVTSNASGGSLFEADLRTVRPEGVDLVMSFFERAYVRAEVQLSGEVTTSLAIESAIASQVLCDEELAYGNIQGVAGSVPVEG